MKTVKHDRPLLEPCALDDIAYQIDPYTGCAHGCYYCYAQNKCPIDWGGEIGIVPALEEKLSAELATIEPQTIYMGMNTDPYQPVEAKLGITRKILTELQKRGFSACVLTKSDYVVRDLDVLKQMPDASVGVSIAFQDEDTRRLFEANTIPLIDRIRALGRFKSQGVVTYALICPVVPFITDVEALVGEARSCAQVIWVYPLAVKSADDRSWQRTLRILQAHFPHLVDAITPPALSPDHSYWQDLRHGLERLKAEKNLNLEIRI